MIEICCQSSLFRYREDEPDRAVDNTILEDRGTLWGLRDRPQALKDYSGRPLGTDRELQSHC